MACAAARLGSVVISTPCRWKRCDLATQFSYVWRSGKNSTSSRSPELCGRPPCSIYRSGETSTSLTLRRGFLTGLAIAIAIAVLRGSFRPLPRRSCVASLPVQQLSFGRDFNQPIAGAEWSASLQQLLLGLHFNQLIVGVLLTVAVVRTPLFG